MVYTTRPGRILAQEALLSLEEKNLLRLQMIGVIHIWNVKMGAPALQTLHADGVNSITFNPAETMLVSGGGKGV